MTSAMGVNEPADLSNPGVTFDDVIKSLRRLTVEMQEVRPAHPIQSWLIISNVMQKRIALAPAYDFHLASVTTISPDEDYLIKLGATASLKAFHAARLRDAWSGLSEELDRKLALALAGLSLWIAGLGFLTAALSWAFPRG